MDKKISSLFVGVMLLALLTACGGGGSSGSGLGGSSGNPTGTTTAATGWEKTTYGTHIRSVGQITDGSFFVAGDVDNSTNLLDGYAMQLNGNGATAWAESPYGGTGSDHFNAIQSVSGGYVVAGDKEVAGVSKAWVMKLDVAGTNGVVTVTPAWQWINAGGGSNHLYAIQQVSDGFIAVGDTNVSGTVDGWVVKLKSDGTLDWTQSYGGTASDHLYAVLQTSDGGYVVAGDRDVSSGSGQGWIMKLDSIGSTTTAGGWDASYPDASGNARFYAIQPGPSGNGYVAVGSSGAINSERGWFVKLSSGGISVVGSGLYFGTSGNDHFYAMTPVTGGYVLAGDKSVNGASRGWVLKVDGNGVSSSEWTYGSTSSDHLYAIQQTQDGGYIAGGSSGLSGWVLKLTKDGAAN